MLLQVPDQPNVPTSICQLCRAGLHYEFDLFNMAAESLARFITQPTEETNENLLTLVANSNSNATNRRLTEEVKIEEQSTATQDIEMTGDLIKLEPEFQIDDICSQQVI